MLLARLPAPLIRCKTDLGLTVRRNIQTLSYFEPPATDDEIQASALPFVRKPSGVNQPSKATRRCGGS